MLTADHEIVQQPTGQTMNETCPCIVGDHRARKCGTQEECDRVTAIVVPIVVGIIICACMGAARRKRRELGEFYVARREASGRIRAAIGFQNQAHHASMPGAMPVPAAPAATAQHGAVPVAVATAAVPVAVATSIATAPGLPLDDTTAA